MKPDDEQLEFEPLPDDWDDEAARYGESFLCAQAISPAEREVLTRFSHLCLRFAHAEVRIQSEILCEIPAHRSVLSGERFADLAAEAAHLAAVERDHLDVPDGPLEDLEELLDDRGIKVIQWPAAGGVTAEAPAAGAFLFQPRTGPALLSLAAPGSPAARFILAHEYCHLIADVDPYENRYCRPGGEEPADGAEPLDDLAVSEARADLFARALLLPSPHLVDTLREFGIRLGRRLDLARLADLAYYYGVEVPVVLHRMADLALISADDARALAAGGPASADARGLTSGRASLGAAEAVPAAEALPSAQQIPGVPPRFANLCLALFLRREVSLEQMAALLGVDADSARGFLAVSEAAPLAANPDLLPPGLRELWRRAGG